jgi:tetratricopeptide (TPR) repeat protein
MLRLALAHALKVCRPNEATERPSAFDIPIVDLRPLPSPWLGSGLCLMKERRFGEARATFQAAAALEPQRALFRAYLGKAASELGDKAAATKEFNLAKRLDPNDPTGWLYSALDLWQYNRINEAIRDLEQAEAVNDSRAPFRSRLLLDRDRSVASADLAAIYEDAGLNESQPPHGPMRCNRKL